MMVALLVACSPAPRFLEPPGGGPDPFLSPALAGCTYTQDNNYGTVITWEYDHRGRLLWDELDSSNVIWKTTYTWEGESLCLRRMTRALDPYRGIRPETGWIPEEMNVFTCDEHDRWTEWRRESSGEVYRFDHRYDGQDQLVETQIWRGMYGEEPNTQVGLVTWLWYDEQRPIEMKYLTPGDGGINTQTWFWDHDRLLGWDIRGSGAERAMTRTWNKDQLVSEVQTEEEVETLTILYTYADRRARFPRDVEVVGAWPRPFGPPRPPTVLEMVGGLLEGSDIEVTCKEGG